MKIAEPLSLRVAKTVTELLVNSTSSISIHMLSHRLDASTEDVRKVVQRFSVNGLVRLADDQIFITEEGLSEVA